MTIVLRLCSLQRQDLGKSISIEGSKFRRSVDREGTLSILAQRRFPVHFRIQRHRAGRDVCRHDASIER